MGWLISPEFLIDWAIVAVSVFNTMLLLWLGLTVLLNSERRTAWHWLGGLALMAVGAVFALHAAVLGRGLGFVGPWMALWWRLGWAPVLFAPFAWYTVMLWYAGFWEVPDSGLRRRQRNWFMLVVALLLGLSALLFVSDLLPLISNTVRSTLESVPLLRQIPLRGLLYPPYVILCIGLSLDAIRRPAPSTRVMGDLARRRARPWLICAAMVLLGASLSIAAGMLWFVGDVRSRLLHEVQSGVPLGTAWLQAINGLSGIPYGLAWLDLIVALLVAVAVLLMGQAIATYEVFTGKTLPRLGLRRQWRSAVFLAAGYSALSGWSLIPDLHPIYTLIVATVILTVFYAFSNWRAYDERERYMRQLRPFVSGARLYQGILTGSDENDALDLEGAFHALCADVLNTKVAFLVAAGPLAALTGPALVYPAGAPAPAAALPDIAGRVVEQSTIALRVSPERFAGAEWAAPLWSERGLIGMLLLGEKRDGGLYSQEEIELARASGERIIDTKASAEMGRRLMALERQRLAETQVLDRRARRVLHDDALPTLHAAMLLLSNSGDPQATATGLNMLAETHRQIANLLREMPAMPAPEVSKLGLVDALRQVIEGEQAGAFDGVAWEVSPQGSAAASAVAPLAAEVIFYAAREAIRNAARHARRGELSRPLRLCIAVQNRDGLEIAIEDDGAGLSADSHHSGGSGQGLALHSTMMAVVGGSLAMDSAPGKYTRVTLKLPGE